ncbi:MAG TPA: formyltetrahydrofolate deformylase [Woeseiaceae bacterium]|nr:formyltetrahydrofolate deformylase [Woeseiaceae bacterium]
MASEPRDYVLTLICPDRPGIVHDVSGVILTSEGNILESAQFDDQGTGLFCMRIHFAVHDPDIGLGGLKERFTGVAEKYGMHWELFDCAILPRVLIMVSKFDHCLRDLLYRQNIGELAIDIPCVVSNHRDAYQLTASYDIPFVHLPLNAANRAEQEEKLLGLIDEHAVDFVVLARYMQILSPELCTRLAGKVINIHHSFLPGFKGARPYHQAHGRGVKLIGATAHYATPDLDEGPIIEQDVARVDHAHSPEALAAVGRDIEMRVLARAVRFQAEHRVIANGNKTVVFD